MAALANARHERFAQELAKGQSAAAAYVAAGYKANDGNASRLAKDPDIQARVAELKERGAIRAEMTVADLVSQLAEDRAAAKKFGSAAAMVSATMGQAKLLGLITDKAQVEATVRTHEEALADLA